VCVQLPLGRLLPCHSVDTGLAEACVHKRSTTRLFYSPVCLTEVYTQQDCHHNEMVSLHNRHLVDKLPYPGCFKIRFGRVRLTNCVVWRGLRQCQVYAKRLEVAKRWIDGRTIQPILAQEVVQTFTGRRRTALHEAHHRWFDSRPTGSVQAFIKVDKYDKETAISKPPRMIQYRGPFYNIELARHLSVIEHELLSGPGLGPTRTPMCSKGMSPQERAQAACDKRFFFNDPVAVCMDYSAFDSTQLPEIIKQEHQVYRWMSPSINRHLLSKQLGNRGRTANGIRYRACGTRMSGDRNTGRGNSITNALNFYTLCDILEIRAEFLCDGDDSVAWMERSDAERFVEAAPTIVGKAFGMLLKDCVIMDSQDDEYYCQHKWIYRAGEPTPIPTRDPQRVLDRAAWTVRGYRGREARDLLAAICVGESVVNAHLPDLANFFRRILFMLGSYDLSAVSAQAYLSNLTYRTGVDCFDMVDVRSDADSSAQEHCVRAFGLPSGFFERLRAAPIIIHPSIVRSYNRRPTVRVNPASCQLCDWDPSCY